MSKRIKGITIEIDGDSTGLEKALKNVDKSLYDTNKQLRDVNKLLKFNPDNVTLLTQKQELLQSAINDTTKRLATLKNADKEAKKQLESGKLGKDAYDKLQREIIETQSKLNNLKNQSESTKKAINDSSNSLKSFGKSALSAGDKLSEVSSKSGLLVAAVGSTIPLTRDLRRDLSNLEQNAKQTGNGMAGTTKAFKTFNAVSGETDSSVEAVSNLLQAGFTKSNLQLAVEGLSGAYSRFPDTLKIESLADSLQETLATSNATGQFGELLDRLGIGADNFSAKLKKCKTEAEKQNLTLKTLSDAGLMDTYSAWKDNNKEMVEYENASIDLQIALSKLAKTVSPIVTDFTELGTKGVNAFNKLPSPVKSSVLALSGMAAVSSPVLKGVGGISEVLSKLNKNSKSTSSQTKILTSIFSTVPTPVGLAVTALGGLALGIKAVYENTNKETIAVRDFINGQEESISSMETNNAKLDIYLAKIESLMKVEDKSKNQKEQLKQYVDLLNDSVEGLNLKYDEQTDKLNKTTKEIKNQIEAQKEKLKTEAYLKQVSAYADEYYQSQQKIAEAQANMSLAQNEYNALLEKRAKLQSQGKDLSYEELVALQDSYSEMNKYKDEVGKLTKAQNELTPEMVKANNALMMQDGTFESLAKSAKKNGIQITDNLKNAFITGKYEIPATVEELKKLIEFDDLVTKAGLSGNKTVQNLQSKLLNGEITIDEATKILKESFSSEIKGIESAGSSSGKKAGDNIASGLNSKKPNVQSAGKNVAQAGKTAAGNVSFTSVGTGAGSQIKGGITSSSPGIATATKNMMSSAKKNADKENWEPVGGGVASGTKKGIDDNKSDVISSAVSMASSALSRAKKFLGIHSPSREFMKLGQLSAEGMALGIKENTFMVEKASDKLASSSLKSVSGSLLNSKDILNTDIIKHQITQVVDYNQIYTSLNSAIQNMSMKVVMDNREVGRALRGIGVEFK